MMAELSNWISNNESVNVNAGTHDSIYKNTYDADNMEFFIDKEATITASNISSSEVCVNQPQMFSEFEEGVNIIGSLMKELNIKAVKKI